MKALSQLFGTREEVERAVKGKWKVAMVGKLGDGSKYGSENDSDTIFNDILGWVTPRELKEAESYGAVVYQYGSWRIPTLPSRTITSEKRETVMVNPRYFEWKNRPRKQSPLIEMALEQLGGVVIDFDLNKM